MSGVDEYLQKYGLVPNPADLPAVRILLAREVDAERKGAVRTNDLALLCCVQLFSQGLLEDVLRIWEAKRSSWDLFHYLDVQLLCGAGLAETKQHLRSLNGQSGEAALSRITECEAAGDFENFSPSSLLQHYRRYFRVQQS